MAAKQNELSSLLWQYQSYYFTFWIWIFAW